MTARKARKTKGYTAFALAAVIYTAGVIAFSFWSYFQQRANVLMHADQLITLATHATDEFLQDLYTESHLHDAAAHPSSRADLKMHLSRLAEKGRFELLGAVGFRDGAFCHSVWGGRQWATFSPDSPFFRDLLRDSMRSGNADATIRMETVELEPYGRIRMGVSYRSITDSAGYAILVFRDTKQVDHWLDLLLIRTVITGILLYAMVIPLIILYHFTQSRSAQITAELNTRLQEDFIQLKEREGELEDAIHDLERFNAVAIGRESRIIELKAEVNSLLEQMSRPKRYSVDHMD